MTRNEIDILWHQAMQQAVTDGEMFTRYHFAKLVAAAEREACAKVCIEHAKKYPYPSHAGAAATVCADAIRARKN